jgi:hypothetical protein
MLLKNVTQQLVLLTLIVANVVAQPALKPHIGVDSPPHSSDPICDIPTYLGNFVESGYSEGDTVADFTLYNAAGVEFNLSNILTEGKPVLLVAGNYTCWRFRDQIATINSIANYYANELSVFIVYGVEAHPHLDVSPYSEYVWTGERNFIDGVLERQPTTYGERIEVIDEMLSNYGVLPEILIDGPCNSWWLNYGPAPVNAYLITPEGTVERKHEWFQALPNDMWCDLGHYLDNMSDYCNSASNFGNFIVTLDDATNIVYGTAGQVLTVHTTIQNLSLTDNVQVNVLREQVDVPQGWQTSLCIDICFNSSVSSSTVTIPPGGAQPFVFYFFTGNQPGIGHSVVRFNNALIPNNEHSEQFTAITDVSTSVENLQRNWSVYPNPVVSQLNVEISEFGHAMPYRIFDVSGRVVLEGAFASNLNTIDLSVLPSGLYFLSDEKSESLLKIVKE